MSTNTWLEYGVFSSEGEGYGIPSRDNPWAGYAMLAEAINVDPSLAWSLRCRRVTVLLEEAPEGVVRRTVTTSPWGNFSLEIGVSRPGPRS